MARIGWNKINTDIENLYYSIFNNYNLENLTKFEKRNIIFDYIIKNISYDFETLQRIKDYANKKSAKIDRNFYIEFLNVLYNRSGICNAIAQLYILLLEKAGIFAQQVCASDGTEVLHAFTAVQAENGCFSFDDPTSVIVKRGTKSTFFNYTIEEANKNGQGNEPKLEGLGNSYFCIISPEWLFAFLDRKDTKSFYSNILRQTNDIFEINTVLNQIKKASS